MKAEAQPNVLVPSGLVIAVQATVVAVLVISAYRDMFPSLVLEWYEHENFSYGFLIPVIFGYLVWEKRGVLAGLVAAWSPWGIASLGTALLVGIMGQTMGEPFLSRISFVLTLGALVHLFGGVTAVRSLAFPIAYLFLMVPPPYPIVKTVSYHLKMLDARIAELLLPLAGVPIYRDAYFLHLPNITLEVADVCSGIASLFAMAALGVLYAYHMPVNRWGKVLVVVAALILPIIANLFRILLIGVSVYYYGPVMLQAFFHSFTGTFTFLLSLAMTLAVGEWIRRLDAFAPTVQNSRRAEHARFAARARGSDSRQGASWLSYPFVGALGLLTATVLISGWSRVSAREAGLPDLSHIARTLGGYEAREADSEDLYRDPYAEAAISRLYRGTGPDEIELFVGYRQKQSGIERLRSPKLVFPTGWEYASRGPIEIALRNGETIEAIWVETRKGAARKLVVYWYRMRDRSFASDLGNRVELLRSLLFHGRTDGAVVRVATPVDESETMERAKQRLSAFAAVLHPEITRVLPN